MNTFAAGKSQGAACVGSAVDLLLADGPAFPSSIHTKSGDMKATLIGIILKLTYQISHQSSGHQYH